MSDLRKGQVRLGPRSWAAIREAYLSGTSAAALAEAYGCSVGTIRYRAVREGWRRCDVAEAAPLAGAPPDGWSSAEPPSPKQLTDLAMAAAMRALTGGRPAEATAYVRAVEALQRLVVSEAADFVPATPEELEARSEALRARAGRIQQLIEERCPRVGD
jgi:hypothetical protein